MKKYSPGLPLALSLITSALGLSACGIFPFSPPSTPTATPTPAPTVTRTHRPNPSSTPNLTATSKAEDIRTRVQTWADRGYLPSTSGRHYNLDNETLTFAQIGYFNFASTDFAPKIFAVWSDVAWDSASTSADYDSSGCGFYFHYTVSDESYYVAYLTLDATVRAYINSSGDLLSMEHTQLARIGVPGKASMALVVQGTTFDVFVNGEHAKTFHGSESRPAQGFLGYAIVSGTNKGYGTKCVWTNTHLWVTNP